MRKITSTADSLVNFIINLFSVALARTGSLEAGRLGREFDEIVNLALLRPLRDESSLEEEEVEADFVELDKVTALCVLLWVPTFMDPVEDDEVPEEEAAAAAAMVCSFSSSEPFKYLKFPSSGSIHILTLSGYSILAPFTVSVTRPCVPLMDRLGRWELDERGDTGSFLDFVCFRQPEASLDEDPDEGGEVGPLDCDEEESLARAPVPERGGTAAGREGGVESPFEECGGVGGGEVDCGTRDVA